MVIKLGINGFGRIGRVIFRTGIKKENVQIAAINDPAIDIEYICYLIKFDSTHGKFCGRVTHTKDEIIVDDNRIKVFHEKLPANVPWRKAGVQYVIEASGMFTSLEKASGHLTNDGVKCVVVTAPSVDVPMLILGINHNKFTAEQKVMSCASSTLYCLGPIVKVLEDNYGVAEGFITSIHAMTPSLKPLDGLCLRGKHWRDHRSIHQNIIPATTGACKALGKIIPSVKDKLSGLAFRVPIVNVSVLDLTIRLNSNTTLHDIIKNVEKAGNTNMQNLIKISKEEAVSSDFFGESHSCILDAVSSIQLKPNFFKLVCWYENEYSYACRVLDSIFYLEQLVDLNSPSQMSERLIIDQNKQDAVNITDFSNEEVPCSVVQETGQIKKRPRPLMVRKPIVSLNSRTTLSLNGSKHGKKSNELFEGWNYNKEIPNQRKNGSPFVQSCVAITSRNREQIECIKAHERLEMLKKEFAKMVNITESLLKKSYNSKINIVPKDKVLKKETRKSADILPDTNLGHLQQTFKEIAQIPDLRGDSISNNRPLSVSVVEQNVKDQSIDHTVPQVQISLPINIDYKFQNNFAAYENGSHDKTKPTINTFTASLDMRSAHKTVKDCKEFLSDDMSQFRDEKSGKTLNENIPTKDICQKSPVQRCMLKRRNRKDVSSCAKEIAQQPHKEETHDLKPDIKPNDNSLLIVHETSTTEPNKTYIDANINNAKLQEVSENLNTQNIKAIQYDTENVVNTLYIDNNCSKNNNVDNALPREDTFHFVNKGLIDLINKKSLDYFKVSANQKGINSECDFTSTYGSSNFTSNTVRNIAVINKQDMLCDKLDSISGTDSNNSFQINERKSQIINLVDLTTSFDDLARLDKICKIIEISDELSNKLFSALDEVHGVGIAKKKWSLKDLCEKLQLDDFCDKLFEKSSSLR